jgi:UDP-N-acetyl-D-mannosaminuronate dehydrogenase
VAEAAKVVENVYRAVNIALVNELKIVLAKMDIDIWEVRSSVNRCFGPFIDAQKNRACKNGPRPDPKR